MLQKPDKPAEQVTSYRPISLLPVISKLFEKLLLKRLKPMINIPDFQFGFRNQHSTIDQVHRIITHVERALEEKKYCLAVFLDVSQAFDKVWHLQNDPNTTRKLLSATNIIHIWKEF